MTAMPDLTLTRAQSGAIRSLLAGHEWDAFDARIEDTNMWGVLALTVKRNDGDGTATYTDEYLLGRDGSVTKLLPNGGLAAVRVEAGDR